MADTEDGVPELATTPVVTPEIKLIGVKVMSSIREWFTQESPIYKLDALLLTHVICTALVQFAAVLAVDMTVSKENFLKSAGVLYDDALNKAPKFGE